MFQSIQLAMLAAFLLQPSTAGASERAVCHICVSGRRLRSTAYDILCGGEQNAVVGRDAYGRVHFAYTEGFNEWPMRSPNNSSWGPVDILGGVAETGTTGQAFAVVVEKIIHDENRTMHSIQVNRGREAKLAERASEISQLQARPLSDLAGELICRDRLYLGGGQGGYVATGNSSLRSCGDATQYCLQSELVRAYCPHTCGCDSPLTGFLLTDEHDRRGCPARCEAARKRALGELACADQSSDRLAASQGWASLFAYLRRRAETDKIFNLLAGAALAVMERGGCGAVANQRAIVLMKACTSSLAAFCPVACGCSSKRHVLPTYPCPTACASSLSR
mmetsp:Transcript_56492/g.175258  ORF Transcript_56492/g.175258 Transcript_56492/m.175258 type:complete len:335 (+) Transcript_56492:25-1029(+)